MCTGCIEENKLLKSPFFLPGCSMLRAPKIFFSVVCHIFFFTVTLFVFFSFSEMSRHEVGLALTRWWCPLRGGAEASSPPFSTLGSSCLDGQSAMSSGTPPAAPPFRKGRKPEKPEAMADSAQATNEELKSKLMDVQSELQQERGKVRGRNVHN